jgi:hypothetical protein
MRFSCLVTVPEIGARKAASADQVIADCLSGLGGMDDCESLLRIASRVGKFFVQRGLVRALYQRMAQRACSAI